MTLISLQATDSPALVEPSPLIHVPPLPEKNLGTLRGGQYPFAYDPVYGLPIIQDVVKYSTVLRDMREGRVREVLWFAHRGEEGAVPSVKAFEGR